MNRLELRYTPVAPARSDRVLHGVVPYLDGLSLVGLVSASGSPQRGPLVTRSYPKTSAHGIEVLDCTCTVHDCGGLDARVVRQPGVVRWESFVGPHGAPVAVGPFTFDSAAYDAEVARIDAELRRVITAVEQLGAELRSLPSLHEPWRRRLLIGIAGPPGAGKSTLAGLLSAELGPIHRVPVVSADGFHLPQAELRRLGRRDRMGAPDTFDVAGFVDVLERLRDPGSVITAPAFDRAIEEPVADAITIPAWPGFVIVEGNYLLHDSGGWERVRPLLDTAIYLAPDDAVRRERLIARHIAFGKTPAEAEAWVSRSDDPNAALVAATASRADRIVGGGAA